LPPFTLPEELNMRPTPLLLCAAILAAGFVVARVWTTPMAGDQATAAETVLVQEQEAARQKAREEAETLERKLDELETAIDKAADGGDEPLARKLKDEAETILKRLDELEETLGGDEDQEGEEGEDHQMHRHRMHLEFERAGLEVSMGRIELAMRRAQLAEHEVATAAHAAAILKNSMEPEQFVEHLEELIVNVKNPATRRMLQTLMAEMTVESEEPEAARALLNQLILGQ